MGGILRSEKLQKHITTLKQWAYEIPDTTSPLFEYKESIFISESIWEDIDLTKWLETFLSVKGEVQFGEAVIKNPTDDIDLLVSRQNVLRFFKSKTCNILDDKAYDTLEWFRNIKIMDKNFLYNALYPSSWYMKWLYLHPDIGTVYHWYRCYFSPLSNAIYPISLFVTPLWFINHKLKLNISLSKYMGLIYQTISFIKKTSKSSLEWYKLILGSLVYVILYIYTTAQSVDLSLQLHTFRKTLMDKVKILISVQKKLIRLYKTYGNYEFWKAYAPDISINDISFPIKYKSSMVYKILTSANIKSAIHKLCKVCVIHDTLIKMIHNNNSNEKWCIPKYGCETFIGNMRNPSLSNTQVANPIRLNKHLIVSGANAGGKTTYVKSLLWNILLGQSFGIVHGNYSQIKVYDGILHHHRIKDVTGDNSLFQAEMFKIKDSLNVIQKYKNVIYFLDEPMHSTNPIDGSVMLKSLLYYLKNFTNVQILLTSHYFLIQEMGDELPLLFKNVSVKALYKDDDIIFDFKIYNGGSKQTIGIELLEKNGFPIEIFKMSAKLKKEVRLN